MKFPPEVRSTLLAEFDAASEETLFDQRYAAAFRDCSIETIERDRWAGTGIPYLKLGRAVRYKKATILAWANASGEHSSTVAHRQSERA